MDIAKLIELYRKCEKEKSKYSDEAPTLEYFIDWLDEQSQD